LQVELTDSGRLKRSDAIDGDGEGEGEDGEEGQDWVLTYTPEKRDESDREKILVRLTPRSLHELYVETKGLSADQRMHGHSAECGLCGEQVNLDRAIPNPRGSRVTNTAGQSTRVHPSGSATTCRRDGKQQKEAVEKPLLWT